MSYIGNVKVGSTTHLVGSTLYGTCNTAAGTKEKAVICTNFDKLLTGVTIHVKFENTNTIADPTLNVNSTGAKAIKRYGTTAPSTSASTSWQAGQVISFTYDGSYWQMNDYQVDTNTQTVTGVKGNSESSYRTGNVNLTAANVGALASNTKYAGASSAGGAATSANKLNTDAGNILNPVYFSSGIPVASKGNSIPFIVGTGSTAGTWLGALDGLTEYYDGLAILYKPSVAGASTTTLNLNSLGAKTCYANNTSKLTTHFPVNQPILLVYSASQNSGCWISANNYWDGNDTAQLRTYYSHFMAGGNGVKQYSLFARMLDGANTVYSSFTTNNGTGTKTFDTTHYFDIRKIFQYAGSGNIASGTALGDNTVIQQNNLCDARYTFNSITTSSGFTANKPVYMVFDKANPSYNCYKIKNPYWTHTPNDANAVYVLVGFAYDTYRISLMIENLAYEYKDSKLVPYGTGGGGGDADLYSKGKIIIDTSVMPSGTSVKVTPTLTGSATTKSVTVGTPLTFDVDCYDYYKIEAIKNSKVYAREYRTVDYGETLYINTFGKSTIGGIKAIVNAHAESTMLAIGDEVQTTLNGTAWTFLVGAINLYEDHEVILVSKDAYMLAPRHDIYYNGSTKETRDATSNIITYFPEEEQAMISTTTKMCRYGSAYDGAWVSFSDKVFIPNWYEIAGTTSPMEYGNTSPPSGSITLKQYPIFTTQSNRIRSYNGSGVNWHSCDWNCQSGSNNYRYMIGVDTSGNSIRNIPNGYIVPCCRIKADS